MFLEMRVPGAWNVKQRDGLSTTVDLHSPNLIEKPCSYVPSCILREQNMVCCVGVTFNETKYKDRSQDKVRNLGRKLQSPSNARSETERS